MILNINLEIEKGSPLGRQAVSLDSATGSSKTAINRFVKAFLCRLYFSWLCCHIIQLNLNIYNFNMVTLAKAFLRSFWQSIRHGKDHQIATSSWSMVFLALERDSNWAMGIAVIPIAPDSQLSDSAIHMDPFRTELTLLTFVMESRALIIPFKSKSH